MKKNLLILLLLLSFHNLIHSQSLYGTSFRGGKNGGGTINKFMPATNDFTAVQSFERPGANPFYTNLVQASNNKLYGMTFNGGTTGSGIIFSYDPLSATYTKLYDFDMTNGAQPSGSLLQASDGKLYGMTSFGGIYNAGVIFSFDLSSATFSKLYDFDNDNGGNPAGSLSQAADGKLYGVTAQGGINSLGVIFSFDISSYTYTKLNDFDIVNGAVPIGGLLMASNGLFYGVTANGGSNQAGVIFSFNTSNLVYTKLRDFASEDGYYPYCSLIQSANGKIYGTTYKGGTYNHGVIFSFDYNDASYIKLTDLDSNNGGEPLGNLIEATDGKLYGMTSLGGIDNLGVIFCFDTNSSTYSKLKDFDDKNGGNPYSSLLQANDGKLYGLTFGGGINNTGVIFSFETASDVYQKLEDFGTDITGRRPSASLLKASDGKLYGMNTFGGKYNDGVIYSYNPQSAQFKNLMDFDSTNGASPYGSLIQATDGKLYGMTYSGGSSDGGIVFSFDPSTTAFIKLNDLNAGNGDNPYGSFIQATDGKLYGLTSNGGKFGFGSIFSFDPSASIFTKLKDFDYTNGANPFGNLVQGNDGKFYGITSSGGNGYINREDTSGAGVIFSFDASTLTYTRLMDFDYYNTGGFCYGSFIKLPNGVLYAMTNMGGANEDGVIFSYDPSTASFNKLFDFDGLSGSSPYGNLMAAGDGKMYGMTYSGGNNNLGVVFSFDPSSSLYNDLVDYDNDNGANSYYGSAFIEVAESGPLPVRILNFTGKNNANTNLLSWKIDNEQNMDYYELQRSDDSRQFSGIFQAKANGSRNYNYNDPISISASPVYYYRLKNMDKNGKFAYSEIIKLSSNYKNSVKVTPNPFNKNLIVSIESIKPDKVTFVLSDASGRQLLKQNKQVNAGTNVVGIDETYGLSKGTYFLTIIRSQQSRTIKVVKGD